MKFLSSKIISCLKLLMSSSKQCGWNLWILLEEISIMKFDLVELILSDCSLFYLVYPFLWSMFTNRIDAEVLTLKKQLESRASCNHSGEIDETNIKQTVSPTIEVKLLQQRIISKYFHGFFRLDCLDSQVRWTVFSNLLGQISKSSNQWQHYSHLKPVKSMYFKLDHAVTNTICFCSLFACRCLS